MFTVAYAWRGKRYASNRPALRQRSADHGRGGQSGSDTRHDFVRDAGRFKRGNFFLRAAEQQRIAALESDNCCVSMRGIDQPFVDEALCRGMAAAALADCDELRTLRQRQRL